MKTTRREFAIGTAHLPGVIPPFTDVQLAGRSALLRTPGVSERTKIEQEPCPL